MLPSFLIITLYAAYRQRLPEYVAAAGVALLASLLLFAEMHSSIYQPSSSSLRIGFNGLALPTSGYFFNNWPFAYSLMDFMRYIIPNDRLFSGLWQLLSMLVFSMANVSGILLTGSLVAFLVCRNAWSEFQLLSIVLVFAVVATVFGAALLAADYDSYSLGGQLPHHIRWYILACGPVALWLALSRFQGRLSWPRERWIRVGAAVGVIFLMARSLTLPSSALTAYQSFKISEDQWLAFAYLHDETPKGAIVISRDSRPFSGIYGRAAYFEDIGAGVFERLSPGNNPSATIKRLWTTTSSKDFCSLLSSTGASYLYEDMKSPLQVEAAPCLTSVWSSPRNEVKVYRTN
jgi:hypothetical protein